MLAQSFRGAAFGCPSRGEGVGEFLGLHPSVIGKGSQGGLDIQDVQPKLPVTATPSAPTHEKIQHRKEPKGYFQLTYSSLIHCFGKHSLRTCYVPVVVLNAGDLNMYR